MDCNNQIFQVQKFKLEVKEGSHLASSSLIYCRHGEKVYGIFLAFGAQLRNLSTNQRAILSLLFIKTDFIGQSLSNKATQ